MARRDNFLTAIYDGYPEIYHFLNQFYFEDTFLYHHEEMILSQRGVQQGGPLGPALFFLLIQPVALSMES